MTTTVRAFGTRYRSKSSATSPSAGADRQRLRVVPGRPADDRPVARARVELVDAVRTGAPLGDELVAVVQREVCALDGLDRPPDDAADPQAPERCHAIEPIGFLRDRSRGVPARPGGRCVILSPAHGHATLRRNAQIALAALAVLAAVGAGFRYLVRGGSPFGQHIVATPASGPVGMRPFFEFPGYEGGQSVTVYLCAGETGGVEDCASLGKGKAGERLHRQADPQGAARHDRGAAR